MQRLGEGVGLVAGVGRSGELKGNGIGGGGGVEWQWGRVGGLLTCLATHIWPVSASARLK